jgi:LAS superfamily LD-carboxypeptidase LdcB
MKSANQKRTMNMRPWLILLTEVAFFSCALLILSNQSLAQTPEEKLQRLSQVLGLSPQQKSQLLPVLQAEAPKLQAIKSNPSLSKRDKKKELKAIHDQADPQVKAILSPTQYQQWKEIRKQEIEEAKEGGGH